MSFSRSIWACRNHETNLKLKDNPDADDNDNDNPDDSLLLAIYYASLDEALLSISHFKRSDAFATFQTPPRWSDSKLVVYLAFYNPLSNLSRPTTATTL